jgi:hypothetical protein
MMNLSATARRLAVFVFMLSVASAAADPICVADKNVALTRAIAYHRQIALDGATAKLLEGPALARAQWCLSDSDLECQAYFRTHAQDYVDKREKSALILYARDPLMTCAFLFSKGTEFQYSRTSVHATAFDDAVENVRSDMSGQLETSAEAKKRQLSSRKLRALRNGTCDPSSLTPESDDRGLIPSAYRRATPGDVQSLTAAVFPMDFRAALQGVEHLSIIPFGPMTTLPLSALKPFGGGSEAVDLFTINYLLFAGDVARDLVTWSGAPKAALIFGNPRPADATRAQCVTDLPWAEKEAQFAHSVFGGQLLDRGRATRAAFAAGARKADVIYLAAHGLAGLEDGIDDSFIALADENLTARDVQRLSRFDFKTRLVVMSACQTGLGRIREFGVIGLARTFLDAGAQNAVMTSWNINDESTSLLMDEFNRSLATMPPSTALRHAQQTLRRNPRFAAPFHWAGFSVYGNEIASSPAR